MEDNIRFIDNLCGHDMLHAAGSVTHILCTEGSMSFVFQDVRYNISPADYVILPNSSLASGFSSSTDFKAIVMCLTDTLVASMSIRSNYGIIGHLALLQNPVMKLSKDDFNKCRDDMLRLRLRMNDTAHLFREELVSHLLIAHILDLYDIHARGQARQQVSETAAVLLRKFVEMLYNGEHVKHRDLNHYASRLCVTPHYLSEVCRKTCGKPASYWIDRFTINDITRMLVRKDIPLTEIAEHFNFSSLSYFSRYVQKQIGVSPSQYRSDMAEH